MQARIYTENDALLWDDFCSKSQNATFLHTRNFLSYHGNRFQDCSILIEDEGQVIGLMPAAEHIREKHIVVSHPGITYGGIVHAGALKGAAMIEAINCTKKFLHERGYKRLQYKATPFIYHQSPLQDDLYALHRLGAKRYRCDLSSCIDLKSRMKVSDRRRRAFKKAIKSDVEIDSGMDYASDLWEVLTENLREKHGASPTHNLEEISLLAQRFPEKIKFIIARSQGVVVAGVVLFCIGHTVHAQYIASNSQGQEISALDVVFEKCIKDAADQGARYFDFGISTEAEGLILNEGLYRFKSEFGSGGVIHEFYEIELER